MKVYDILTEAPIGKDELRARRERAAAANQKLRDITANREKAQQSAAKASADSTARRQKYTAYKQQNPVKSAVRSTSKAISSPKTSAPVKSIGDYIKSKQAGWHANQTAAKAVETKWAKGFGPALTMLMRVIGIATSLTQLYLDLDMLDQEYKQGYIDQTQLEQGREFLFGVFTAQILVPAAAKLLARAAMVTRVARIIKWLAAGAGGAVTGGASIAAAFATEGFFIWLQSWLGSDAGKNWLANSFLLPVVKTMGKIPEGIWSSLTGYYEKSAGAAQGAGTKPAAQPAAKPAPGTISADDFIKSLN